MKSYSAFDIAFREACQRHNVKAAYFVLEPDDPTNPRSMRMVRGGDRGTLSVLNIIIAAGRYAVSEPIK